MDDSVSDLDLALARLGDEVARALAAGETPDAAELASRFGVSPKDAEGFLAALQAIHFALDEDLPGPLDLPPPVLPADFELLGELGRGGMGVVYKVRQKSLDRVVALKVLRPAELVFGEAIRRFQAEARSLARLRHRHIVSIHEVGESGGNVYYTMDLIEGSSLAELVSAGKVTPTRAVRILRQVAGAITYAHSQGLIHRDLKPANILIDPAGDAYVVDFGLARDLGVRGDLTATGHILGTPAYMSPEQARGDSERIGEPTDLYALGAVLYECLSGRPPFSGLPLADLIHAVIHEEPAPPSRLAPKTPSDLEVICLKAMEKDPHRRYPTVRAFLEDLERFEAGRPILARPPTLFYRLSRFVRRQRVALASAAATAGLLACLLLALVLPKVGQTPETMLATAEDLFRAGQHSAAEFLCGKALEGKPDPDLARKFKALRLRCRVEQVRALEAQGRWEEAKTSCKKIRRETEESDQIEILWELAQCQAKTNEPGDAAETLDDLQRLMERKVSESPRETSESVDHEKETIDYMLDRMAPALLDPSQPGHEAAGVLFSGLLAERAYRSFDARRWIERQGARTAALFVAILPFLPREMLGTEGMDFYSLVGRIEGSEMDAALVAAIRDEKKPILARRFAADLLSARQDLPLWLGHWRVESALPDKISLIESAASLWEELRPLSRREAFRKKVEFALHSEREHGDPKDNRGWFREWMAEHTGHVLPRRKSTGELDEYTRWWDVHGREDPREWLDRALGLPSPLPAEQVFDLYLHTPTPEQIDRRNWLHQLLVVSAPETVRPPLRRSMGRGEPEERPMAWYRALGRTEKSHLIRIARLIFSDGKPEPEIEWQESHSLRIGESLKTQTHERTIQFKSADWAFVLPGLEPATDRHSYWSKEHYAATVLLKWSGTGLQLVIGGQDRGFDGFVFSGEGRSYGEGHPRLHLETKLTLVLSEADGDPRDWTLQVWKNKILQNLDFLLKGIAGAPGGRREFFSRYQHEIREVGWLCSFLKIPEAAPGMIELDRLIRGDKELDFHMDAHRSAARLLAGDATVLDDAKLLEPFLKELRQPYLDSQYLSRLILSTEDPGIRTFAFRQLEGREMPVEVLLTLDGAIQARTLEAPPWLASKARAAALKNFDQKEKPRRRAGYVGLAVGAVGLILVLRLLWPRRPLEGRFRTAIWLLLLALVVIVIRIEVDGVDYLPDSLGYALAALATGALARGAEGKLRFLPSAGFLLAGIVSAVSAIDALRHSVLWIGTLGAAGGIVSLPLLIRALDASGTRKPEHRRLRLMLFTFPFYAGSAVLYQLTSLGEGPIRAWNAWRQALPLFSWIMIASILTAVLVLRSAALQCAARRAKSLGA